jgi:hypothetical protein
LPGAAATQSAVSHEAADLRRCAMKYQSEATALRRELAEVRATMESELVARDMHMQRQVRLACVALFGCGSGCGDDVPWHAAPRCGAERCVCAWHAAPRCGAERCVCAWHAEVWCGALRVCVACCLEVWCGALCECHSVPRGWGGAWRCVCVGPSVRTAVLPDAHRDSPSCCLVCVGPRACAA